MKDAAVFILLGQSNAVGHGVPMAEADKISIPLQNVFGLHRDENQSYDVKALTWSGYTSGGMNLGETQDHTYSVANCLACQWQDAVDAGKNLPDLYIVQIAIGAQGVTEKYMWYPDREKGTLIPGALGTANMALFPLTCRVLSLLQDSFAAMGKTYEIMGLHWRGGEEEDGKPVEVLQPVLKGIYDRILKGFWSALGEKVPTVLHRLVCEDCWKKQSVAKGIDSTASGHFINSVFEALAQEHENVMVFDVRNAPHFVPDVPGNGLFKKDLVHFTPESNQWVAAEIMKPYMK